MVLETMKEATEKAFFSGMMAASKTLGGNISMYSEICKLRIFLLT